MTKDQFDNEVAIELTLGHVLVLWDFLRGPLADTQLLKSLSPGQRRAVWALEDICEDCLGERGIGPLSEDELNGLIAEAIAYAERIPADYAE